MNGAPQIFFSHDLNNFSVDLRTGAIDMTDADLSLPAPRIGLVHGGTSLLSSQSWCCSERNFCRAPLFRHADAGIRELQRGFRCTDISLVRCSDHFLCAELL